jgi:hypothetical protein
MGADIDDAIAMYQELCEHPPAFSILSLQPPAERYHCQMAQQLSALRTAGQREVPGEILKPAEIPIDRPISFDPTKKPKPKPKPKPPVNIAPLIMMAAGIVGVLLVLGTQGGRRRR